jgi:hypothetical protein
MSVMFDLVIVTLIVCAGLYWVFSAPTPQRTYQPPVQPFACDRLAGATTNLQDNARLGDRCNPVLAFGP